MKKISKLITIILAIVIILIQNTSVLANVVQIGETKYVERGAQGDYTVMYYNKNWDEWFYIGYSQTYYTDDTGTRRIAYCNTPDLDGVGWLPGEYSGYDTTIQRKLSNSDDTDKKLWRVFKNGYPYSSLNVECDDDAYLATKQAAYFMLKGRSEEEVYTYFKPNEENEWLKFRGQKVIDEIYRLVYLGNHGEDQITGVNIEKIGEIINDKTKEGQCYQEYAVSNNGNDEKIEIIEIKNAPQGTIITDDNGNEKMEFSAGEHFKINFINNNIEYDYNVEIKYKTLCKNYPVFFSKSNIENTQDYLLSVEKYDDEYSSLTLFIDSNKCNFEILKIDEKTEKPVSNVTFDIKYKNGDEIGKYTTNEQGKIKIENLKPGEIIVTEVDAPIEYIVNTTPREFTLYYNSTILVQIDNKQANPKIKIEKHGPDKIKPSEEIRYNFNISNEGNISLENFTWFDFLPCDKAKITKISTGTYSQKIEYNVYYKTDKNNEYILLKENLDSSQENYINLSDIKLSEGENITEIKFEFGIVDTNFKSIKSPYFYLITKNNLENDDIIINNTKIEGEYRNTKITSKDSVKTIVENLKESIETKKLPRTGF